MSSLAAALGGNCTNNSASRPLTPGPMLQTRSSLLWSEQSLIPFLTGLGRAVMFIKVGGSLNKLRPSGYPGDKDKVVYSLLEDP